VDDLRQRLKERLDELRGELEVGENRMYALDRESDSLQQTMLRIHGAITVLEEVVEATAAPSAREEAGGRDAGGAR